MNRGSTKQWVDPESTTALKIVIMVGVVTGKNKGANALSRNSSVARWGSTQPFARAESKRLLKLFFVSSATGALSDLVCTARALAFVAEEEDLGHSLAVCR